MWSKEFSRKTEQRREEEEEE
jgi:hypothetical protein